MTTGASGSVAVGAECVDDDECMPGDACDDTAVCVADSNAGGSEGSGAECYDDVDCESGVCDQSTDVCM